jgi:hypothetical protein
MEFHMTTPMQTFLARQVSQAQTQSAEAEARLRDLRREIGPVAAAQAEAAAESDAASGCETEDAYGHAWRMARIYADLADQAVARAKLFGGLSH